MTPEEITAIALIVAPQYANDPRLIGAVLLAEPTVAASHCYRDQVLVLLGAHTLEVAGRAGSGGAVASSKEGGLEVSYFENKNGSDGLLATTSYGAEVQRLNFLCYGMSARTGWIDGW